MKIKSLLLGSAAAMLAVSGAQAADAIVVEPEPVEYVRVCDAYGAGFFYIPGTETCIRFGGYVRSSYQKLYIDSNQENVSQAANAAHPTVDSDFSLTNWAHRGRMDVDTRNETDWGTLRAQLRFEAGDGNGMQTFRMDRALISIAGFRFGFTDNYWSTNHGYGGVGAEDIGLIADGGWYAFNDATMADYTFAANGFALTVGVEDPRIRLGAPGANATNTGGTDGRANFYAGFNWSDSWGSVAFTAVHDSLAGEYNAAGRVGTDTGGWAYKASLSLNLSSWIPGGSLTGWWMHDGDYATDYVHNWGRLTNPETIWGVAYQMNLTDELQFYANYWHADGGSAATTAATAAVIGVAPAATATVNTAGIAAGNEGSAWQAGLGLNWFPAAAPGFSVRTSYIFGEVNDTHAYIGGAPVLAGAAPTAYGGINYDYHGFNVTVRRNF